MNTLYIIGNGFDLWHKLPTSYNDFYEFAPEVLEHLESYFYLEMSNITPWADFENRLGEYDWEYFYAEQDVPDVMDDSFKLSMTYGFEDGVSEDADNLVSEIDNQFHEWVYSIDTSEVQKNLSLVPDAIYLSFNYTPTLQNVYGVNSEKIFHIHGNAFNYDKLIFGHSEIMEEEPEFDAGGESNRHMFSDAQTAAKHPFYAFQKPVESILKDNENWFESLIGIDTIIVLGHSLNEVDIPYFKKIVEVLPSSNWIVSYHLEEDLKNHTVQLNACGITPELVRFCKIDDVSSTLKGMG